MRLKMKLAVTSFALLGLASILPGGAAQAEGNWAREVVSQREQAFRQSTRSGDPAGGQTARIVGGTEAPDGKWPFQVAILLAGFGNNYDSQYCGGVLIKQTYVVTAAHCVDFVTSDQIRVLTGTQNLKDGGERRRVRRIKIHPDWDDETFDSDIAVLELREGPAGIDTPEPASPAQETALAGPGTKSIAIGWGDRRPENPDDDCCFPAKLRQVQVPIVSMKDCDDGDSYDGVITKRMICAGRQNGGKDACQGDAGGPLLTRDENGKYRLLVGITSFAEGCARPEKFGVYTRVSKFQDWIEKHTN